MITFIADCQNFNTMVLLKPTSMEVRNKKITYVLYVVM